MFNYDFSSRKSCSTWSFSQVMWASILSRFWCARGKGNGEAAASVFSFLTWLGSAALVKACDNLQRLKASFHVIPVERC